jgi:hypothetical protein
MMVKAAEYSRLSFFEQCRELLRVANEACLAAYHEWLSNKSSDLAYENVCWACICCSKVDLDAMRIWIDRASADSVALQDFIRSFIVEKLGDKFISLDVVTEW